LGLCKPSLSRVGVCICTWACLDTLASAPRAAAPVGDSLVLLCSPPLIVVSAAPPFLFGAIFPATLSTVCPRSTPSSSHRPAGRLTIPCPSLRLSKGLPPSRWNHIVTGTGTGTDTIAALASASSWSPLLTRCFQLGLGSSPQRSPCPSRGSYSPSVCSAAWIGTLGLFASLGLRGDCGKASGPLVCLLAGSLAASLVRLAHPSALGQSLVVADSGAARSYRS